MKISERDHKDLLDEIKALKSRIDALEIRLGLIERSLLSSFPILPAAPPTYIFPQRPLWEVPYITSNIEEGVH